MLFLSPIYFEYYFVPILIIVNNNKIWILFLAGCKHLRLLLSFSVGGMLGDVFLHVLPEVWISSKGMFYIIFY